mgnify:CR=1 FL=1
MVITGGSAWASAASPANIVVPPAQWTRNSSITIATVMIATGVTPRHPAIPGVDHPKVLSYVDVLAGNAAVGAKVAIIGAAWAGIAAAEAQAVVDCAYIDCNYDTNCYTSFCLDEWYACTQGPLTCEQEVACIQHCAGDSECRARCYYESTAVAQKQYDDLEFCRMSQSCAELDDQCMKEFCTWNYMACLGWP